MEAAKLLQKAREEPKEEGTPEDSKAKHVEEKRLTMQAMHVPHEEAGSVLVTMSYGDCVDMRNAYVRKA